MNKAERDNAPSRDWIRVESGTMRLVCERCGQKYQPSMPCPIDMYLAQSKSFTKLHKSCRARAALNPKPGEE